MAPFPCHACRSIKLSNAAFQQRVAAVEGSLEILALTGFEVRMGHACNGDASTPSSERLSAGAVLYVLLPDQV